MCNNWATYGETNVSFRFADITGQLSSFVECGAKQFGLNAGVLAVHAIGFGFIIGGTGVTQRWCSMKSGRAALAMAGRLFAWAALLVLAFVSHPVLSSVQFPQRSTSGTIDQSSAVDQKGNGVITG